MKYPFLFAAMILLSACGEKKSTPPATVANADTSAAPKKYFPVVSFIRGEIAYVDSLPVGIKKYYGNNKKKYTYIKAEEFHRLANEFIPQELTDSSFEKNFGETSFLDASTNSGTFLYTAKDPSLSVQRVDVLTTKGDIYDQVKSIYLQKNYRSGDTMFTKKLYWRPKQSFQIITEAATGGGEPRAEIVNVVWDNREEE